MTKHTENKIKQARHIVSMTYINCLLTYITYQETRKQNNPTFQKQKAESGKDQIHNPTSMSKTEKAMMEQ